MIDPLTDWVPSMKACMTHGEVGDRYYVCHVSWYEGKPLPAGGSVYEKNPFGYSHVALENEWALDDPFSRAHGERLTVVH